MKPNAKLKWIYVGGLCALMLVPVGAAIARPTPCITDTTMCDHDLLCAFKVELAEKILLYETFVANTPATNKSPGHTSQGVRYGGSLYDQALQDGEAAAKNDNPRASAEDIASAQYDAFAKAARQKLNNEAAQYEDCSSLGVQVNNALRGTWSGMHTDRTDCSVYGDIGTGARHKSVTLDDLLDQTDGCREVYDSDRGHERVHETLCNGRRGGTVPPSKGLQGYIDEDIEAYRFSVQSAANDLERLQLLCSADPNTQMFRDRAADLLKKAARYKAKKAGK